MTPLRCFLLLICMAFARFTVAQVGSYQVTGQVVDAANGSPLPFSAVMLKGSFTSTETDAAGNFTITADAGHHVLVIFQYGYATKEQTVSPAASDSMRISLQPKAYNLGEVVVKSRRTDTLQASNHTEFLAFEFYDNFIVALVNKGKRSHVVQLLNDDGTIIRERQAPPQAEMLFKDCLGNIQLLSKDSSYQFYYNYETIEFLPPYAIEVFARSLQPCQCVLGDNYYFKEVSYKNLKNTYYKINRLDLAFRQEFARIENAAAIEAFNTDYDINYFLAQRRKGQGYAMSVEEMKSQLDELRENLPLSPDYAFLLSPARSALFKVDSSLLIVDFTHRMLFRHHRSGALLASDSIRLNGLSPFVVQDADRQTLYFVKEANGLTSLYEFQKTGTDAKPVSVERYRFLRNVRCRNGVLYFLNRNEATDRVTKIFTYRL